jgi:hypothetical protein
MTLPQARCDPLLLQFWDSPIIVMSCCTSFAFLLSIYGFYITERELVPWVYDFQTSIWWAIPAHNSA